MTRTNHTVWVALVAALVAHFGAVATTAAQESDDRPSRSKKSSDRSDGRSAESGKSRSGDRTARDREDEVRLNYDGDERRLRIRVDEDVQFENGSKRPWTRDGEFDLRYDADGNLLRAEGEGTVHLNRVGNGIARWWQSYWEEDRQNRRGSQANDDGVQTLLSRFDKNDDGALTRQELPKNLREDFNQIDRNSDDRLSRRELQNYGDELLTAMRNRRSETDDSEDRTWSEWWTAWWSDESQQDQGSTDPAAAFLKRFDKNDDSFIAYSELPQRLRKGFGRVDSDGDGFLSESELENSAMVSRRSSRQPSGQERGQRSQQTASSRSQSDDDRTWGEWWSAWWQDSDQTDTSAERIADVGAREFLRQHDANSDDQLVRTELPQSMYDDFTEIDRNRDGTLTRQELARYAAQSQAWNTGSARRTTARSQTVATRASSQRQGQRIEKADLQRMYATLQEIDRDGNGEISRSELQNVSSQTIESCVDHAFQKMDQDGNDSLSKSEVRGTMLELHFEAVDRNDDDKISMSELRQKLQSALENAAESERTAQRSSDDRQ